MKKEKEYIGHLIAGLIGLIILIGICFLKNEIIYAWIAAAFGVNILIMDNLMDNHKKEKKK